MKRVLHLIGILALTPLLSMAESEFPPSSSITAQPLPTEREVLLHKAVLAPLKVETTQEEKQRIKNREALCGDISRVSTPANSSLKTALAIVESDIALELSFTKPAIKPTNLRDTEATDFSVYIEFAKNSVVVRSSLPRYASDAAGLRIEYPGKPKRLAWLEGKKGADLLFIIPQLADCSVQAIAVCPRTFVPRNTLVTTSYIPNAVQYYTSAKADGLYATGSSNSGKVQASALASPGIELPLPWYETGGGSTPSATLRYSKLQSDTEQRSKRIEGTLPIIGAVEARLDFGDGIVSQRTVSQRTSVQVTPLTLERGEKVTVRGAQLSIEPGACFLVTRWKEVQR